MKGHYRPKRFGAPPKREPIPGERVALSLRMTPDLKGRLDAAAEANGRSQSQEAEFRLERTFDRQDLLTEALSLGFGPKLAGFLLALGHSMKMAAQVTLHLQGRHPSEDWTSDPDAFTQAAEAARELFVLAFPLGQATGAGAGTGRFQLELLVEALGSPTGQPATLLDGPMLYEPGQIQSLRKLLGDVADRVIDAQPKREEMRKTIEQALSTERSQPSLSPRLRALEHEANEAAREVMLWISGKQELRSKADREMVILSLFSALMELNKVQLASDESASPGKLKEAG